MDMVMQNVANGICIGSIYTLVALGLTIIFGILDIVNFSHGQFYMLGAFATYYVAKLLGGPYVLAVPAAFLVVGIFGLLSERVLLRPVRFREGHLPGVMVTYGLMIILGYLALIVFGPEPRRIDSPFADKPLELASVTITEQKLLVIIFAALFVFGFNSFVKRSRFGRALRAVALDKNTAALMGINVNLVYQITFAFGCGIAAVAGGLLGPMLSMDTNMGHMALSKAFVVVILGGMGSIMGALAGGMTLGVVESLTAAYVTTAYKDIFGFSLVIVALLFFPQGLTGRRLKK
jgi:branched-chain amino acid transport system permease protein